VRIAANRFGTPESDGSLGIIPKCSDYWGKPYAIFSDDEQISKAFSTEADVWKHARENGLVVEIHDHED